MTKVDRANHLDSADILIIGNGIAGLTAAVEARRLAPDSRIVLITEQSHPTINTPALKQFAIGKLTREQLLAYPAGTERAQLIHVVNARVEAIHPHGKYVSLQGGRAFGYDTLLIATGSAPTGLPPDMPGRDFDGVLTLHRLNDYLDLRRRLSEVAEAVVIGGGAHAIETVMCLRYWGIEVHWLIRSETFMPRTLDRPASDRVLDSIRHAGARVYTGTEAIGIVGRVGAVAGVVTNHHQLLPCQLVLACTGTTSVTTLAKHCDLPIQHKNGIIVDDQLRTSVPDIYAAGDAAALRDPQTGAYAPRAQWYAAVLQGRMAAAAMTGHPHEEGFGVPWHATRLGELSMLTVGNVLQWNDAITTLTDSSRGSYRRICVVDDRLVGYLSLGPTQPDSLAIKRIIDEGLSICDIKKALLKGEFDARKYFSRQRTFAAQRMITTGKLPTPYHGHERIAARSTGELQAPTGRAVNRAPALPDTDPSVAVPWAGYDMQMTSQLFANPFVQTSIEAENASTDTSRASGRPFIVESTLAALPARTSPHASTSLWHYSGKLPVFKGTSPETPGPVDTLAQARRRPPKRQFIGPPLSKSKPPKRLSGAFPSSSIWFYSDKLPVVKKGR